MLKVALTGGIGSGKSEAGEIFSELGAVVIDSDILAKEAISRGSVGFEEVLKAFGDQILTLGDIDRKKLAEIIFKDPAKRRTLENIIHPLVRIAFEQIAAKANQGDVVINLIPLLVETAGKNKFDYVITVSAPIELRKERLINRGLKSYEIENRIASQVNDEAREKISDFVIDNSGSIEDLRRQVESIFQKLRVYATKK